MRILHCSASDRLGGAAAAAYNLHTSLLAAGVHSRMRVGYRVRKDHDDSIIGPDSFAKKVISHGSTYLDRLPLKVMNTSNPDFHSMGVTGSVNVSTLQKYKPDCIHLHWIASGFMSARTVANIPAPIVWTLHDMWPFDGASHYTFNDERYITGYTRTNRPKGERGPDLNRWVWNHKMATYGKRDDMVIVAPCRWLADCAQKSTLFRNNRVEVIPYGVDTTNLFPQPAGGARKHWKLPENGRIVLIGSADNTNYRKGAHLVLEALRQIDAQPEDPGFGVACFGNQPGQEWQFTKIPVYHLGWLNSAQDLARAYSAADLFIAPSIQENLANTVLESLACGTPVLAFSIGGMPDMIDHGRNGFLADNVSVGDLRDMLIQWRNTEHAHFGENARKTIEDRFTCTHQAQAYIQLYQELKK